MMDANVLEHAMVPEHHLVPQKDEVKLMKSLNVEKDQLPKIRKSDPCVKVLEEFYGPFKENEHQSRHADQQINGTWYNGYNNRYN